MDFLVIPIEFTELGLSSAERIALSVIYNYSKGKQGAFYGSYSYLSIWMGCTKRTTINVVNSLVEKGYIRREKITKDDKEIQALVMADFVPNEEGCKNFTGEKISPEVVKKFHRSGEKISPYNKEIINTENKKISTPPRTHTCEEIIEEISASFLSELEQCKADYPYEMIEEFKDYWLAKLLQPKPKNKIYLRFQTEKTFSMRGRLRTWARIAESRRQEQVARMPRSHNPTAQSFAEAEKSFRRIAERQAEAMKAEEKLRLINEKYIDDHR